MFDILIITVKSSEKITKIGDLFASIWWQIWEIGTKMLTYGQVPHHQNWQCTSKLMVWLWWILPKFQQVFEDKELCLSLAWVVSVAYYDVYKCKKGQFLLLKIHWTNLIGRTVFIVINIHRRSTNGSWWYAFLTHFELSLTYGLHLLLVLSKPFLKIWFSPFRLDLVQTFGT